MKRFRFLAGLLLCFLSACGQVFPSNPIAPPAASPSPVVSPTPVGLVTPEPTPAANQPAGNPGAGTSAGQVTTLRLWLPPQFDPRSDNPAAHIFNRRLEQFRMRRPGVNIQVRLKAVNETGGLLDSLITANAAAPAALPDLVALPRDLLETAALKGLIYPYDSLSQKMNDGDWYEYAQDLSKLQQSVYGLPFAGDALTLVYRPSAVPEPPQRWEQVLARSTPLVFAAADPQAALTMALYQSSGGKVQDAQGRPSIDALTLTEVLSFYHQAETSALMSEGLTQFQSDDQVWQAYQQGKADLIVCWTSRYLSTTEPEYSIALLPTAKSEPFSLATGWVWGLAVRDPARQAMAVELAEFLTESSFLAEWTQAAGFIPPRPSALKQWEDKDLQAVIEPIARVAHSLPQVDVISALSGPFWQATVDVLKHKNDPATAAQAAAGQVIPKP